MVTSVFNSRVLECLNQCLSYRLSLSEWRVCEQQLRYYTPKVGKFWESQTAKNGLYLILSGKVRLLDTNHNLITTLSVGETFGELTLFQADALTPYCIRVGLESRLCYIPIEALVPLMDRHSSIQQHLLRVAEQKEAKLQEQFRVSATSNDGLFTALEPSQVPVIPTQKEAIPLYFPRPSQRVKHLWQKTTQRYPFFEQQSSSDCGAACLVMIAKYWGKRFSLNLIRELSNVNRDGASLFGITTAAEALGFMTKPIKATLRQLSQQPLPAIAHWEGKHYIVVYRITPKTVIVGDPAIGQRSLTHQAFEAGWTGYSLLLTPTQSFSDVQEAKTTLWRFLELLTPHRLVLTEILLASLFIQLFGLVTPLFTQLILDRVVEQGSHTTLTAIGIGLLLFTLFRVAMMGLRQYLLDHTSNRLDLALIGGFIRHTFLLPLNFFETRYVGDLISRVQENRKIQRFLSGEALTIFLDLLTVFIYVGLMFWYSWKLAGLVLLIIPPFVLLALLATPFLQRISREIFKAIAEESSYLIEALTGIRTIKASAVEQSVRWQWEERFSRAVQKTFSGQVIGNQLQIFSNTIEAVASTSLLWYGASLVLQKELTIGQLVAFHMLLGNIIRPFQRLSILWNQLQEVLIAVERINDVFEAAPEENLLTQVRQTLPPLKGHVQFENVTFRYNEENDVNTLQNLTFQILPGQMVAVVGRSGSGKTTLAKLLLGLYPPTEGRILVDGYDVTILSLKSLRQQVGIVDQDTFLFGGTIRENMSLGHPDTTLEALTEAARLAGAEEFIKRLPMGYESQIGEGGGLLSGGQKQRIAIARALVGNPRLLIFDEATSHLDTESERIIQQNLGQILKGRTTLVIAHRLSTIRHADQILVLERGVLIESGTHETLLGKNGYYAYLVQQQSETPIRP